MAQTVIRAGAVLDTPNTAEMADQMSRFVIEQSAISETREREHARGIKLMRRDYSLATPAQTRITTLDDITPQQGYVWCILQISAQLASSGSFQAFITSDSDTTKTAAQQRRLVGSTSTNNQYPVLSIPKNACVLYPGEGLFLNASANIQSYFIAGWEVIAEMQWKLL